MWRQRRNNLVDYRKVESSIYNGQSFHSKKEVAYAMYLDAEKAEGRITGYKRQVKISLDVNGYHICNYYIDFLVDRFDGITEYVEVNGFLTDVWRIKWKLFEALYSEKENVRLIVEK